MAKTDKVLKTNCKTRRGLWLIAVVLAVQACNYQENAFGTRTEVREVVFDLQGGTQSIDAFPYNCATPILSSITVMSYEDYPFPGRYSKEELDSLDCVNWNSRPWAGKTYPNPYWRQTRMEVEGLTVSFDEKSHTGVFPIQIDVSPSESPRIWRVNFYNNTVALIGAGTFTVIQQ